MKQILSLPQDKALHIFAKSQLLSIPAHYFSAMFQMYARMSRWSSMQADLLGLTLQMLDWKSLLSVSAVSKYYRLQVSKPNNWKNIKV
jgi:hypothetical protein